MNSLLTILLLGLLPAVALFIFIYVKDRLKPEPAGKLFKAFSFGVLSTLPVFAYGFIVQLLFTAMNLETILNEPMFNAFVLASIPEEASKMLLLWLVLRGNKHFDEKFDGIVYGACVALGFAAFENIGYLFSAGDEIYSVAFTRALLAVPMHFLCGVAMGYYISMSKFYPYNSRRNMVLAYVVPMIVHGLYDFFLFLEPYLDDSIKLISSLGAIGVSVWIWKRGLRYIREHILRDEAEMSANEK